MQLQSARRGQIAIYCRGQVGDNIVTFVFYSTKPVGHKLQGVQRGVLGNTCRVRSSSHDCDTHGMWVRLFKIEDLSMGFWVIFLTVVIFIGKSALQFMEPADDLYVLP